MADTSTENAEAMAKRLDLDQSWFSASRSKQAASLIRALVKERDGLREALGEELVIEEYDYPGDAPEFCGWLCRSCGYTVEADGSGHKAGCVIEGMKPYGKRADRARAALKAPAHD